MNHIRAEYNTMDKVKKLAKEKSTSGCIYQNFYRHKSRNLYKCMWYLSYVYNYIHVKIQICSQNRISWVQLQKSSDESLIFLSSCTLLLVKSLEKKK
jgi:hypothetical protein